MKTIIGGVFTWLTQEKQDNNAVELGQSGGVVSEKYTVRLMEHDGFHAKSSRALELDLSDYPDEENNKKIQQVKQYLKSRIEPDSALLSAKYRFDKLGTGNGLLSWLRAETNDYQALLDLYEQAKQYESGFDYPTGELGRLIIDCRREVDAKFDTDYKIYIETIAMACPCV